MEETRFNTRATNLEVPGTRKFSNQVKQYDDGVDLTLGQSGFETPEYIREAMIEAINQNKLRYTHNRGLIELREAISQYNRKRFNVTYDAETEIIVTNGGSEAIDSVLRTILEDGDEVIIPCPTYLAYEPITKLQGAKTVLVDTTKTNFVLTKEALVDAITPKTKAIIFNYPTNPTGMIPSLEQMKELVDVLKETDIFILTDEIYSDNVYDGEFHSFMEFSEVRNQLFVINGLSKSHAITGGRIGYILAPPLATEHVTKVHLYNSVCVATPSQYGATAAFTDATGPVILSKMNEAYKERRDFVYKRLKEMGLSVESPKGAFYIFPDISEYNNDSFEFATELLEVEHLAVVPGKTFSIYGEGHIRLSFACTMEELVDGCKRLERFLSTYRKRS
ncbi:aminotransferase class I/II-fold pyridoxal phosphate-dependent enzyme [Vagococcus sp. CY52-2]|uniref:aminotransferase class I/II-fold pyridoxal phosphate-dependent enzyme n=1 Tax=Vagococcus sp. CY52-2 TaxID=2925838 RepID=UPI001F5881CD|nr:aminotransferase class I/II-fold pyridoxal phosphate-dependent enzyme [Vagococcus sp. CY52-2]UNM89341.1 aminotransferase class I/II-fold pyridoxal phosphate-dependent enzyme [Vagococcus sp. CY52-2]